MASLKDLETKLEVINLRKSGYSKQKISKLVGIPRKTVSDFLCGKSHAAFWVDYNERNESLTNIVEDSVKSELASSDQFIYKIETSKTQPDEATHIFICDTQCKPDINTDYLAWVGHYIVDRKPDVIIHAGDHADMPSLSSYDRGKRSAEGRRVTEDINAAIAGMNRLLKPLYELQQKELELYGKILYKPRMVLTLGNHEQRIERHVDANPELYGFLSYDNLRYKDMGWEVYDFLKPVTINGVAYVHFMANPMTGKPYGGTALNILKNVGESFTTGHKQVLDVATRFLPASGRQQWAIIAGACYMHDEDYKGPQGNHHWRGVIVKHNVKDGSYNPMFVNLEYLQGKFGDLCA